MHHNPVVFLNIEIVVFTSLFFIFTIYAEIKLCTL